MLKIYDPLQWKMLTADSGLTFANPRPRPVKLEVNWPSEAALYYVPYDDDGVQGEPAFLALVKGRETIEFVTRGAFQLAVEGPDGFVFTADGDHVHTKSLDPKIFTKIADRRRRDFDAEYMAYVAQQNINARMEQMKKEIRAEYEAQQRNSQQSASSPAPVAEPAPVAVVASGTAAADAPVVGEANAQ